MRRSASTNASERAGHASIQISASGPGIPGCPRSCPKPGPALDCGQTLSPVQVARICVLGMCNRIVDGVFSEVFTGLVVNLSVLRKHPAETFLVFNFTHTHSSELASIFGYHRLLPGEPMLRPQTKPHQHQHEWHFDQHANHRCERRAR